ncbi:MAG: hypothetical protein DRJ56_04210 [Thermoprotei archaeon]|nr:MAG: hypothetical protein DRJ56_04210 [Thermoprotei archaeon]
MRSSLAALLTLVICAALCRAPLPSVAATDPWEVYDVYWVVPPATGQVAELAVVLRYLGSGTVTEVNATLDVTLIVGEETLVSDNYTGTVKHMGSVTLSFRFTVPESAKANYYRVPLTVEYVESGSRLSAPPKLIEVSVRGRPSVVLSADRQSLPRRATSEVLLTLRNNGTATARLVEVKVYSESPYITVTSTNTLARRELRVGESWSFPISLYVSEGGDGGSVAVTVTYRDQFGGAYTDTVTVGFTFYSLPRPKLVVASEAAALEAGATNLVILRVRNVGDEDALDVELSLRASSPHLTVVGSGRYSLGTIPKGGEATLTVPIYVEPTSYGTTSVEVVVSYSDSRGSDHLEHQTLGFEIESPPRPRLRFDFYPKVVKPGRNNTFVVRLTLAAGTGLELLRLSLHPPGTVAVLNSTTLYISNVPVGTTVRWRFVMYVPREVRGTVNMPAVVEAVDVRGRTFTDTYQLGFVIAEAGRPHLDVRVLNETLWSNEVNAIVVALVNLGDSYAKNVTVTMSPLPQAQQFMSLIGTGRCCVDRIEANSSVSLTFKVFVQPRVYGAVQLYLSVAYYDEWGDRYDLILPVGFSVRGRASMAVARVVTSPIQVFPGDRVAALTVYLTNIGDYVGRSVRLTLEETEFIKPAYENATEALIPYAPVGETIPVTFLVSIDERAPPGRYELRLRVRGADVVNETLIVPLTVHEKADFRVIKVSPSELTRGDRGVKLMIELENAANATADDVRVSLVSPYIVGATSTLVGRMEGVSRRVVIFEVDVDKSTPLGELRVDLQVRWSQGTRDLIQTIPLVLTIRERRGLGPEFAVALATASIAAVVLLVMAQRGWLSKLLRRLTRAGQGLSRG